MRTLAASFALLALTPAVLASDTSKAIATVKASTKSHLKEFKQAGAAALADLDTALDALDGTFSAATTPTVAAAGASDAITAFLAAVVSAHGVAVKGVVGDADLALETLAHGGQLNGIYPDDFYFGTGGALDDSRTAMDKQAGKLRTAALKRIGKTFAKAEAVGLGFAMHMRFPSRDLGNQVDQGAAFGKLQGASIDLVLSVSRLADANDGVIVVSGPSDLSGDVTVDAQHYFEGDEATVSCFSRFSATFTALAEGGYTVGAIQGKGLPASTDSIGVR